MIKPPESLLHPRFIRTVKPRDTKRAQIDRSLGLSHQLVLHVRRGHLSHTVLDDILTEDLSHEGSKDLDVGQVAFGGIRPEGFVACVERGGEEIWPGQVQGREEPLEVEGWFGESFGDGGRHGDVELFCPAESFRVDPCPFVADHERRSVVA